jgi:5'-3' exonuclease
MEADDKLAIRQHELTEEFKHKDNSVIVTLDKDLDQVIGWHYNFVKKEMYYMEQDEADLRFFKQFLTGDRIDNIQGVHGIGDKKSQKLLEDLSNKERWDCVVEHLGLDRAIENGHLLYMLRSDDDNFEDYAKREGWL